MATDYGSLYNQAVSSWNAQPLDSRLSSVGWFPSTDDSGSVSYHDVSGNPAPINGDWDRAAATTAFTNQAGAFNDRNWFNSQGIIPLGTKYWEGGGVNGDQAAQDAYIAQIMGHYGFPSMDAYLQGTTGPGQYLNDPVLGKIWEPYNKDFQSWNRNYVGALNNKYLSADPITSFANSGGLAKAGLLTLLSYGFGGLGGAGTVPDIAEESLLPSSAFQGANTAGGVGYGMSVPTQMPIDPNNPFGSRITPFQGGMSVPTGAPTLLQQLGIPETPLSIPTGFAGILSENGFQLPLSLGSAASYLPSNLLSLFAPQANASSGFGLNSIMSIGSGIYGLYNQQQLRRRMQQLGMQADPFGNSGSRAMANSQLQALLSNPSGAAANDPSYALRIMGAQRANAMYGQGSGRMAVAGADASTSWYNDRLQQLGALAGAGFSPAAAGQLEFEGATSANRLAGDSLASIGYGLSGANRGINPVIMNLLKTYGMNV